MSNQKTLKVLWIGRGGHGVVTASSMLAASYVLEGKKAISMPEYGVERRGAPVKAYTIISFDEKTDIPREPVKNADVVLVLEKSLIEKIPEDIVPKGGSIFIINSSEYYDLLNRFHRLREHEVWSVNATNIALEVFGKPLINMVMLGSYVRAVGSPRLDSISILIEKEFRDKSKIELNEKALRRGYEEARLIYSVSERRKEEAYEVT